MKPHRGDYTRYDDDTDEDGGGDVSVGYPDEFPRVVPKSAVYHTTQSHPGTRSVSQRRSSPIPARASRTRLDVVSGPPPRRQSSRQSVTEALPRRWRLHPLLIVGLALIIAILGWVVFTSVATWVTNTENHWQYGYPRTAQYDVVVGHQDSAAHPSHFIALNDNGQVEVIEFPGGDTSHARIYTGVAIVGQNANLVPVTLAFRDVNGDGKLDMIVIAGNARYVFLNEGGQFVKANQQS